jgi:arabinan endo-1,5-alpha-L-arabinosidase
MAFGSFWNGIKIVKRQPNMKAVVTDSTQRWFTIAARERNWKVDERDAGDAANPELDY